MHGTRSRATSLPPAGVTTPRHSKQAIKRFAWLVGDSCGPRHPQVRSSRGGSLSSPATAFRLNPGTGLSPTVKKKNRMGFQANGALGNIFLRWAQEGKLGSFRTNTTSPVPSQGTTGGSGEGTLGCQSPITVPQRKEPGHVHSTRSSRGTRLAAEGPAGCGTISHGWRNHRPSAEGRGRAGGEQPPHGSTRSPGMAASSSLQPRHTV